MEEVPRVPPKKRRLEVYIDEETYDLLCKLVRRKYPSDFRGPLSEEVESALRAWIAEHMKGTDICTEPVNPPHKVYVAWEQVKRHLLSENFVLARGRQVPKAVVVKAIMAVRGSDRRTVRKWLSRFVAFGLLKPLTPTWAIFEVLG